MKRNFSVLGLICAGLLSWNSVSASEKDDIKKQQGSVMNFGEQNVQSKRSQEGVNEVKSEEQKINIGVEIYSIKASDPLRVKERVEQFFKDSKVGDDVEVRGGNVARIGKDLDRLKVFVEAQELGEIDVLFSGLLETVDGLRVPLKMQREHSYVKSVLMKASYDGSGNKTEEKSLEVGTVQSGIDITMMAKVLEGNGDRLKISSSFIISELVGFEKVKSAGMSIEQPVIAKTNYSKEFEVAAGSPIVLSDMKLQKKENNVEQEMQLLIVLSPKLVK